MSWVIIEHEGVRRRIAVAPTGDGVWVGWPGGSALVKSEQSFAAGVAAADGVVAPMTGKIVQVEVEVGDAVQPDQLVVVMEAMKMEYRLTAPHGGEVQAVHCAVGDLVDLGTTLVKIGS